MRTSIFILGLSVCFLTACKDRPEKKLQKITPAVSTLQKNQEEFEVVPIQHASMVLNFNGMIIYVDPVGGPKLYEEQPSADLILITHEHPDHFEPTTLLALVDPHTKIIAPALVTKELLTTLQKNTITIGNGETKKIDGIQIKAFPMYNLREAAQKFHSKGQGNGYILSSGETKIYIAGDTGDIPEMRNLKNVDIAFIPMNLPYTMPVGTAADAVLDFKPKKVYPYHYKGKNKLSDVGRFKNIVETNSSGIEVVQLDWYPDN